MPRKPKNPSREQKPARRPGKQTRSPDKQARQAAELRRQAEQARVDQRRAQVAALLLQGKTYRAIGETVGAKSTKTVFDDVQAIIGEWKKLQAHKVDEWVALELEKIGRAECEAWEAWERSKQNVETRKIKTTGDGVETTEVSRGQAGDPRFLDIVLKCATRRCELLGLDAPLEIVDPSRMSPAEIEAIRKKRWADMAPALAAAEDDDA
jgi:hypothetical protein